METAVGQTEGLLVGLVIVIVIGAIIGWLSWRQKRAIAQHLERKAQEDQTPPK